MSNQKGAVHIFGILVIILLAVGLFVLLGLVQNPIKLFSRASISNPTGGSVIKIYASGTPAKAVYPTMILALDGKYITKWDDVKGSGLNGLYVGTTEYVYTFPNRVRPGQIGIGFANDLYDAATKQDRNLRVDKIVLDGIEYQTEDPSTYSEGSYGGTVTTPCGKGYAKSEWLFCNGFFVYKAGGPSPSPTPTSVRVFITSTRYNGNLGGLSGADAKCQARADAAQLGGVWKAWLSDSLNSASSRLIHGNIPYKLLDGKVIANNWNDLTDGNLANTISLTETKSYHGNNVWTGTKEDGGIINPGESKCNNWTSAVDFSGPGAVGHSGYTDYHWTWGSSYGCNREFPLYCFEQVKGGGGISAPVR